MTQQQQKEFGDFQTPPTLAASVARFLSAAGIAPETVVEPTCGEGAFVLAALAAFPAAKVIGYDIRESYVRQVQAAVPASERPHADLAVRNFFEVDWDAEFAKRPGSILVMGNPPWVTNSQLGAMGGGNLPPKSNIQNARGFAAKTGKSNFDISEWMMIRLLSAMQHRPGCLAMLCKTATARKVLRFAWMNRLCVSECSIHLFDAQSSFGVSVDACLLIIHTEEARREEEACIYEGFSFQNRVSKIGFANGDLVSDIEAYRRLRSLDGQSCYTWRSGMKHDAASVMELTRAKGGYLNKLHEPCEAEDDYVYPFLKSSDLANERLTPRRFVLVTQHAPSDDTAKLQRKAPRLWQYLQAHADILNRRKSMIYQKRAPFCVFGIGEYSFAPWKVAISGLYKNYRFVSISVFEEKPILLDDTCYSIPCQSGEEARFLCSLLNSDICREFIDSLAFRDAKRPITVDVLNRMNLFQLAQLSGHRREAGLYFPYAAESGQTLMVFEPGASGQTILGDGK